MKRMIFHLILTATVSFMSLGQCFAQKDYTHLRNGDQLYDEGRYPEAETSYRKALEANPKAASSYDLANSMFLQERIPEAISEYQNAIKAADEQPAVQARAYYNMGNAYYRNNEFQQSINAYKETLKINPSDEDAKKNLMLAMRQMKQQQKQEQKQNQQDQQQEEQEQQQDQKNQEQQQQQQQQQQAKEDISKEEAKEILKAIEREDQRVQEKLKKTAGKGTPPVKDW